MTIFTKPIPIAPEHEDIMEMEAPFGQAFGAELGAAFSGLPSSKLMGIQELQAAETGYLPISEGVPPMEVPTGPDIPAEEARKRVKEAGVGRFVDNLPDAPIKQAALDIIINRAKRDQERAATITRGPHGFVPGALAVGTSLFVGAMDPLNIAASFIPVIGETNYARILALGGESAAARVALRTGMGAVQGAAFGAAFVPIDYAADTQQGRDYTMSDALNTVIMSAATLGAMHGIGGAVADFAGRYRTNPAGVAEEIARRNMPEAPVAPEVPRVPLEIIENLPPQARQDMMRGAVADVTEGRPVAVGEMVAAAAENDPRIAAAGTTQAEIRDQILRYAAEAEALGKKGFAAGQAAPVEKKNIRLYRAEGGKPTPGVIEPYAGEGTFFTTDLSKAEFYSKEYGGTPITSIDIPENSPAILRSNAETGEYVIKNEAVEEAMKPPAVGPIQDIPFFSDEIPHELRPVEPTGGGLAAGREPGVGEAGRSPFEVSREEATNNAWRELAGRQPDPTAVERSREADALPEPASTEPRTAATEVAKLADEAEQQVARLEAAELLPEDVKKDLDAKRAIIEQTKKDWTQMYQEAAQCLIAGADEANG